MKFQDCVEVAFSDIFTYTIGEDGLPRKLRLKGVQRITVRGGELAGIRKLPNLEVQSTNPDENDPSLFYFMCVVDGKETKDYELVVYKQRYCVKFTGFFKTCHTAVTDMAYLGFDTCELQRTQDRLYKRQVKAFENLAILNKNKAFRLKAADAKAKAAADAKAKAFEHLAIQEKNKAFHLKAAEAELEKRLANLTM
jgi:hypothetical protein